MVVGTLAMREGAELVGENGFRYLLVRSFGQPNVWLAVDAATQEKIFIVKQPSADDLPGWPHFQHEMIMHELFKENPVIRQQVDRIPPTSNSDPPRLVLELLQTTLWDARRKREFSNVEIKEIMRSALLGLQDVHSKDMVYAGMSHYRMQASDD
jgi:protein kinase